MRRFLRAGFAAVAALTAASTPSCRTPEVARAPASVGDLQTTLAAVLDASSRVVVRVDADVMDSDRAMDANIESSRRPETERRRVRDAIRDLVRVLSTVSSARVEIATSDDGAAGWPIVVGDVARQTHGAVSVHAPYGQGYRVLVTPRGAALYGESGLATSYAIYDLLDRLGCRWFFPGPHGEVLPPKGRLAVPAMDVSRAPSTIYRGVWYADDDWKRRNQQGGLLLQAGHALELVYVTKDDRAAHPEWIATIGGKPHASRLKWSSDSLAAHVADRILAAHAKDGAPTYSISPDDGADFDESAADRALDAGDFDPTTNQTSLTDRFLVLANRVAARVAAKEPDVLLGFLAYVQYTRPPVRESVHPSLVPQIAPITYARAHPMDDDRAPGNRELRAIVEGWGKKARAVSMYVYGWFLSEPVAPNPMITKWGHDVPYVLAHGVKLWQPETMPSFESNIHALYMGMRLAFDASRRPDDVFADLEDRLYGHAAKAMHDYWRYVDHVWVDTPEYSGGEHGHARRFRKERIAKMRALLDAAKAAAITDEERKRVELADDSLSLFEDFMKLRWAFVEGRFDGLDDAGKAYAARATALGNKWEAASAFAKTYWAPQGIYAKYYDAFLRTSYEDAARLAKTHEVDAVLRHFTFRTESGKAGTTDVAVDSWSALGLHDYFGAMTYETSIAAKRPLAGKRALVWIGAVDGAISVQLDGRVAPYVARPGGPKTPEGFEVPLAFDVTELLRDGVQTLTIRGTRKALNELGVGGLTGPVVLAHER